MTEVYMAALIEVAEQAQEQLTLSNKRQREDEMPHNPPTSVSVCQRSTGGR